MSRCFWPVAEEAQAHYETLREAVLAGKQLDCLQAARFARRGLAGLLTWPTGEPLFTALLVSAARPAWTPRRDPRLDALGAGYAWILSAHAKSPAAERAHP